MKKRMFLLFYNANILETNRNYKKRKLQTKSLMNINAKNPQQKYYKTKFNYTLKPSYSSRICP